MWARLRTSPDSFHRYSRRSREGTALWSSEGNLRTRSIDGAARSRDYYRIRRRPRCRHAFLHDAAGCGGSPAFVANASPPGIGANHLIGTRVRSRTQNRESLLLLRRNSDAYGQKTARKLNANQRHCQQSVGQVAKGQCVDWRLPEAAPPH